MQKPFKEIVGALVFTLILIGLGVMMIIHPDLGGYEPHGRHYLIKKLIVMVWGTPAGILSIIVGLVTIVGIVKSKSPSLENSQQVEQA